MKIVKIVLVVFMSLFLSVVHSEGLDAIRVSGGGALKTQHLFTDGYAFNQGTVVQFWGEALHEPSGLYLGTWLSVGLRYHKDEIDGTFGWRKAVLDGEIKLDVSFTYARFLEGHWGAYFPQAEVCGKSIPVCGMAWWIQPDDGSGGGWMVDGSYAPFSWLLAGVNHAEGVRGAPPSTVLRLVPSYRFNEYVSVSAMGQYPSQDAAGRMNLQIVGKISVSF